MMSIYAGHLSFSTKTAMGILSLMSYEKPWQMNRVKLMMMFLHEIMRKVDTDKDGQISYDEFVAMMKTGTDRRKASRQYSRERFQSLSVKLMKDGSLHLQDAMTGQTYAMLFELKGL